MMTETSADAMWRRERYSTSLALTPSIRTVSVIGAGVMGRAIAACSVRKGFRVQIFDSNPDAAANAVREFTSSSPSEHTRGLHLASPSHSDSLTVATSFRELADADLVIEAVPENPAIKCQVLLQLAPALNGQTIVASNTSSIPLSELIQTIPVPESFCGLHFCHPVAERPLVEVITTDATSAETCERAVAFAHAIGKSPVIVRDGPGFVLNRILSPYLTESMELALEGVDIELLDQAAHEFGMPCGPLRLIDEFGIDVCLAVGATLLRAYPDRFIPSELLIALYKTGRRGSKSGGGFYDDDDQIAPCVRDIISKRSRPSHQTTIDEIHQRLFLPMFLEATRVLEEQAVESPETIDRILQDGLGMTAEYRGLFGWAEAQGSGTLLSWLSTLQSLGDRYATTPLLLAMIDKGSLRKAC
ncbi:MAG: hypothetical protein KDA86_22330 [Planctomycetaceae bacterium]|nr:hypothetical protein [Planctomycetaceae bacterium]